MNRVGLARRALWVVVVTSGCTSQALHLTATPLQRGQLQWGLVTGAIVQDRGLGLEALPNVELSVRYGVADACDVGGRVNVLGLSLNARCRLLRVRRVGLALVPETGFGLNSSTGDDIGPLATLAGLALLADLALGPRVTAVAGIRFRGQLEFSPMAFAGRWQGKWMLMPGGSLGARLQLAPRFFLFPELSLLARRDTLAARWLPPTGQLGISMQWL